MRFGRLAARFALGRDRPAHHLRHALEKRRIDAPLHEKRRDGDVPAPEREESLRHLFHPGDGALGFGVAPHRREKADPLFVKRLRDGLHVFGGHAAVVPEAEHHRIGVGVGRGVFEIGLRADIVGSEGVRHGVTHDAGVPRAGTHDNQSFRHVSFLFVDQAVSASRSAKNCALTLSMS